MKNTIVLAFARMNPQTASGHGLLVKKVIDEAIQRGADHVIYLSKTQDKKKNPLPVARKVFWAKKMFPGANIVAADNVVRTFIDAIKAQSGKYKKLVVIAGSDRIPEYKLLLDKYNGKDFVFNQIEVVSAGERDPDQDGAAGMSATKMRDAAAKGDIASFKKGLPASFKDSEANMLMKEVRAGMGISEGLSFSDFLEQLHEARGSCWDGFKQLGYKKKNGKSVPNCVPENKEIEEQLNKPYRTPGESKKFAVKVKDDKGNERIVRFGDPGLSIKTSDPERRKSFRARHNCDDKNDKTQPGYWSCRMWASKDAVKKELN